MNYVSEPQSFCQVGVARGDITPPVGIYHRMWGAAVHERSTGVHKPLTATVLFLKDIHNNGSKPLVAIGVDHCLLWPTEMNTLLTSVSKATGVELSSLIVFFSHTHGAGLMGLERKDLPGGELIEPYLKDLATTVAHLVKQASQQLQPATIVYGQGSCALATHRDFFDQERGHYVCGFNPSGVADHTVIVGRVTDTQGAVIATIVNYACHPTTLAWDNTLISPDYIGAMREVVEGQTHAPCLFIQGASGDIGPKEGFVGDVEVADRNGRQLGYAALAALESMPPAGTRYQYTGPVVSGATIGVWTSQPESEAGKNARSRWQAKTKTISLKYRSDLPTRQELEQEDLQFRREEQEANAKGDIERARVVHAMVERTMRRMIRIAPLTEGDSYSYPIHLWRIGDAIWIALDGEHYNILQRILRERFPQVTLVIGTIANGSKVWYLPDSTSYGRGLYQEEVSVLERGCLESVIEATSQAIQDLIDSDS